METGIGWIVITGYAAVQSMAFVVLFIAKKSRYPQIKWILVGISLCCAAILTEKLVSLTYGYERFPHMIFAMNPLWYLLSPLLYGYLCSQLDERRIGFFDLIHLLPFAFVMYNMLDFYRLPAQIKLDYLVAYGGGEKTALIHHINYIVFFVQALVYAMMGFAQVKSASSDASKTVYRVLLSGLLAFSVFGFVAIFAAGAKSELLIEINCYLFLLWLVGFVTMLFAESVRHPQRLYFVYAPVKSLSRTFSRGPGIQEIRHHLSTEKPFLDADYDIHLLASTLGCSKHHLVRTIKQETNQGFRDFINSFRIREAQHKLLQTESRQYTIQSIAEGVGFKSPATFYRIFKKKVGVTPSVYMSRALD